MANRRSFKSDVSFLEKIGQAGDSVLLRGIKINAAPICAIPCRAEGILVEGGLR
jgi:hypothetical protein